MKNILKDDSLQAYRLRLIELVISRLPSLSDEQIDAIGRICYSLPEKPENSKPYLTWMTPIKSSQEEGVLEGLSISGRGIDFIKRWEGFRATPYYCSGGVLTIGWGHTKTAKNYNRITKLQGEELLVGDLRVYENYVKKYVTVSLNQYQYDALVSFCFNLGGEALRTSSLKRVLNEGNYRSAANWFPRYCYAGKKMLPGLLARRNQEKSMFLTGTYL